jgi:hypothetical protein
MVERELINVLFGRLINAPLETFPLTRGPLGVPDQHGVYVIYGPRGKVLYVGRTQRAMINSGSGLRRRLAAH